MHHSRLRKTSIQIFSWRSSICGQAGKPAVRTGVPPSSAGFAAEVA
ncbi:MAG: hypothetical protein HYV26_15610 [Candidatus Hydrogenedentes bacterium]|nr:hypothetical protein [Candidatus Hydrogenedentota bacterium]